MITNFNKVSHAVALFVCTFFFTISVNAQKNIEVGNDLSKLYITDQIEIFVADSTGYNETNIASQAFAVPKKYPVFFSKLNDVWTRFSISKLTEKETFLQIQNPNIGELWLYRVDSSGKLEQQRHTGNSLNFESRKNEDVDFILPLTGPLNKELTFYLHFKTKHPLELPISIISADVKNNAFLTQSLIIGVYSGLIVSILLYNIFLFISTKDRSYFMYVIYLFFLGLAQLSLSGWAFKYFWSGTPWLSQYAVVFSSCLAGIFGIAFAQDFLHTRHYTYFIHKFLYALMGVYVIGIFLAFTGNLNISYHILNYNSILGGVTLLVVSYFINKKGFRHASFYFIAWFAFLAGLIIFALRNMGFIPTNDLTRSVLYIGSAIEAVLLSIALADKINTLQKEKEISQAEALRVSQENETLVREQNVMLEKKVAERTEELQQSNKQLNTALVNLKDAQTQLVEAEKMASLGQLTAGIAHEINNPINFVKSNIKPLQLDIRDLSELLDEYNKLHTIDEKTIKKHLVSVADFQKQIDLPFVKTEIDSLIKGIEEGAERTAEIVRGLRTFSRLDEGELKTVNIHEGIDSTLVLLKNSLPYNVKITKDFKAKGDIDCLPGKLNQVFMNILNNGIQAIQAKEVMSDNESIGISTRDEGDRIIISIKDSGIGMNEEVKQKIFEPFFTTKAVGEGTGLGMAIVFKIIEKHQGKIDIISSPGNGSEFTLSLPHTLSETS
ncbi:sensor histidine kinase [Foetidibacter luteolus]|uniref:sensor histidine kinase n=1 Tax=Foetidibacter luteolus TaxID=2608880 RepID=UPI00129BB7A5|nr:7TM diverse intracellular signaling domain-containing protein [Foetidibacter luteolus]